MKLSVIIPAYNEEAYLDACLRAALADWENTPARDAIEFVVVDNASTDKTAEVARSIPGVRVVHEPAKGVTRARQRGLVEASGDLIAFIDADTRMPSGWLTRVLDAFQDEQVVCVSGPYVYYDLGKFRSAIVQLYWRAAQPVYKLTSYMAVGGNFAARKTALERCGGFDSTIAFYGEDTDIARRLSRQGKVVFDLHLVMQTSARRLRGDGFVTTAFRYVVNFVSVAALGRPVSRSYRDIR